MTIAALSLLAATGVARADCDRLQAAARAAAVSGDVAAAVAAADAAVACPAELAMLAGRAAAAAHYVAAARATAPAEVERLLTQGLRFGRPWALLAWKADLEWRDRRFAEAARLYQEALDDLADARLNPTPPRSEDIARIHRRAGQARQLADRFVPTSTRGDCTEGLGRGSYRGYTVERTVVPVAFEFDSTAFTADGARYAAEMLCFLGRRGAPAVRVVGHADPSGAAAYNLALSERRAEAVRAYMRAQGYAGAIQAEGRGEREPAVIDDATLPIEARHALHRRVEIEVR